MSLDTRVSELIKRIYSAGDDVEAWDSVLITLFRLANCCAGIATLVEFDQMRLHRSRVYGPQYFDVATADYAVRFGEDPALLSIASRPEVRFCESRATLLGQESDRHPFVQWASANLGSSSWYTGCSAPTSGLNFCLTGHFSNGDGENPDNLSLFRLLFDHLECAMRLANRGFSAESARALIRLNDQGRVEQLSSGARRILQHRPLLTFQGESIQVAGLHQRSVDRALKQVLAEGEKMGEPTAVQIKEESGRSWLLVFRPVAEAYGPFGTLHCKVDLEIFDRAPAIARLDMMQSLFDLTGRELQVVRLLSQGHSIDSLSETIEVSRNTTRAHLRSIYAKTKTSSQSELMQLCGGLSSVVSANGDARLGSVN